MIAARRILLVLLLLACATSVSAGAPLPGDSVYQLDVALTDQDGAPTSLGAARGSVRVVTLFYASCPYVCPLIIDTLKRIDGELADAQRARLAIGLVSMDPERDTPAALKQLAVERGLDESRWRLLRASSSDVRKIAGVLGIQYRQLENREFNHSSALILLDAEGRVLARSSTVGTPDPAFVAEIRRALDAAP